MKCKKMKHTKKMVILILCATLIAFGLAVYFKNPEFYEMFASTTDAITSRASPPKTPTMPVKTPLPPRAKKPNQACLTKCKDDKAQLFDDADNKVKETEKQWNDAKKTRSNIWEDVKKCRTTC